MWLYLDADGFFASCEEASDPLLHGRPLAVIAGDVHHGAVLIAVNAAAKRNGIHSGATIAEARTLCPSIVIRSQRVERYVDVHERLVRAVGSVLPVAAVCSIDEICAKLAPTDRPASIVAHVAKAIEHAVGPHIPVSIAAAPNPWIAKCAAEANKPKARIVWTRSDLPRAWSTLSLKDLPGAGPATRARLRAAGIADVETLARSDRSRAIAAWGSIEGDRARLALRGAPTPLRYNERRSISHARVLTGPDRDARRAKSITRWLAICARERCNAEHAVPSTLTIIAIPQDAPPVCGAARINHDGCELCVLRAVTAAWNAGPARYCILSNVSVTLEGLRTTTQRGLFHTANGAHTRLTRLLSNARALYGARAIGFGNCSDPNGPYSGAKIAYQSFPDHHHLQWLGIVATPARETAPPKTTRARV